MEIYISIDGVLRNLIQKFEYLYTSNYLDCEVDEASTPFDYKINTPIKTDDLRKYFEFQNKEEYDYFTFFEFPLELFGYAGLSYATAISDLNKLIYNNKNINFTLIGLDELGKAKPSTLFFLSKNTFLGNNIKFISTEDIEKEWKNCDIWISDNVKILSKCPKNKKGIKFNTNYNFDFHNNIEINDLINIDQLCLKSWGENITSTLTNLSKNVQSNMLKVRKQLKLKMERLLTMIHMK